MVVVFFGNCYFTVSHVRNWNVTDKISSKCLLYSEYKVYGEVNPLIYLFSKKDVDSIVEHDMNYANIDQEIYKSHTNNNNISEMYLLLEFYSFDEFIDQEFELFHGKNKKRLAPIIKYSINIEIFDPYFFFIRETDGYPRRIMSLNYTPKFNHTYSILGKKGTIQRVFFNLNIAAFEEDLFLEKDGSLQRYSFITKGISWNRPQCSYF